MKNSRIIGRFILVSGISMLAACGGGGSGDGGSESSGSTLSLDAANYASKKVEISSTMNVEGLNQLSTDLNDAFSLVEDLHESLWDQSGGVSGTTNCDGGGTAKVTYAGEGWNDDESWEFSNCIVSTYGHGNVLLNGSYRYVDTLTGETTTSESWKGYETYNISGEIKSTGEPLAVKGRADWDQVFRWDNETESGRMIDTIDAFELKVGDRYIALTNAEMRLEGTEYDATFTMKGKLIGSAAGGYVQISTPTAVRISDYETCPMEGVIQLASDGTAEIRYGSSAAGTADAVAVWIDGQIVESYADCNSVGFSPVY